MSDCNLDSSEHPTQKSEPSQKVVQRRIRSEAEDVNGLRPNRTISSLQSVGSVAESTANYASPSQAVIIYDWDDTLCPSHWIQSQRPRMSFLKPAPDEEWAQKPLRELEAQVTKLLTMSLELGRVVIVTNALEPWVETSCVNFLPGLLPVLEKIEVVYARSIYAKFGVDKPTEPSGHLTDEPSTPANLLSPAPALFDDPLAPQRWKEKAFQLTLHKLYSEYERQSWKNIVCIGDSPIEHQAVRMVISQRPLKKRRCYTKTTKLLHEPTIEELISQIRIIQGTLPMMVAHDGQLDIEIGEDDLQGDLLHGSMGSDESDDEEGQ